MILDSAPGIQPFGFAGGLNDAQTALVRFGARDYSAELGRWVARDPIRFGSKELNHFVYVSNAPTVYSDPYGLSKSDKWYGAPKRIKKWYHRQFKDEHGPDGNKKKIKEACDEWNSEGQPGPDNKRGRTRNKTTPPDEDPWDDLDIIIPFPDLPSPRDFSGGLFPDLCGGSSA